jgi:hypothetical protein
LFVVAPMSRAVTPVVPPAGTSSRPVTAAFQAKMVAPAHSAAGLLLRLTTLAKEAPAGRGRGDGQGDGVGDERGDGRGDGWGDKQGSGRMYLKVKHVCTHRL